MLVGVTTMETKAQDMEVRGDRSINRVEWTDDILLPKTMDAMMMLLARRDITTDLAGLWLSNLLDSCLVLPE